ncbi:hypothetical protein [Paenibacillus lignilyticus]|uniref:Beta-galactosidase trimerisation domain-containing protein n=1 Tax=Paenibacillus lignilyticus TaxID=1172615 RepID=A0ABS5C6P0_9BACL|nr:hypothetical protein [Paenibacillus lignilyticus]MBP3961515.1 hypothetical protein [Paenibacillus lignilyticus]
MYSAPIMLLLDTSMTMDHHRIRQAVSDIYEKGFDTVCVEFRNNIYDEYDPQGKAAVQVVSEACTRLGLQFLMIMPMLGPNIVKEHPEARQSWAVEHTGQVVDKRFSIAIKRVHNVGFVHTDPRVRGVAKAFHIIRDASRRIIEATDITDRITFAIDMNIETTLAGAYEQDGEILVYARYDTDYMDFAYRGMHKSVDSFLEQYEGLPLDGYAIDEFGAGCRSSEDVYFVGSHFLAAFKAKYGYDLLDRIYLLKNEAVDACAGKVRYDYYQLTIDLTYDLQKYVKDRYTERFGENLFGGFHSTWWGEGNSGDLWAGNIDYFRLTDNLSGGFVDAQFDAERTMVSMTMLAESLAKYSSSGHAYNMCWDRNTTKEKLDYYQRLLAVRNVRWVGHAYGYVGPFGPGYPDHSTWADTKICLERQKTFQQFIGTAVSKPKLAMMYVWESVAFFNNEYMHYHRLSLKAVLDKMMQEHIEIDLIPTSEADLARYDMLIVLWPTMLPEAAWQSIQGYAAAGRRVIFIGPPAQCTVEGRDIRSEFEQLTGAQSVNPFAGKLYTGDYEYVEWDIWFAKSKIEMQMYPLTPIDGETTLIHDGDIIGVSKSNVEYFSFEMPLTSYFETLMATLTRARELDLPPNTISKVSCDGDNSVLSLTGRWEARINCSFTFRGNKITITDGVLVGIRLKGNRVVEIISDADCTIEVNGSKREYVTIG